MPGDFNGDGKTDILWDGRTGADNRSTGTRAMWLSNAVPADIVTSITTGIGASLAVTYKPLTDASVYTKDSTAIVPMLDLQGAMYVVSRVDAGNGIGGTLSSTYAYVGAKVDLDGRGFLGFRKMTVTDLQTNIVQATAYRQDFPFTGLVANGTRKLGTTTLSATTNGYGATALGGTRYQVYLNQSQATGADLDGSVLPTATSAYQYDAYSNATQIQVVATDGFIKTTTNTYANDTANWFLGRLTNASVASQITSPGSPPPQAPTNVIITSSSQNLNLWNYLLSNGVASAGVAGSWTVTIASNVVISSASSTVPALDTGVFPPGSILQLINNGVIIGAGGKGGNGGLCKEMLAATSGAAGGTGLRAQVALSVVNNAYLWGGGGGGGGYYQGGGGGGGAGIVAGAGGVGAVGNGASGTVSNGGAGGANGGNGGNAGLPGAGTSTGSCWWPAPAGAGGAAGAAASGNSFITWVTVGDRRGPLN